MKYDDPSHRLTALICFALTFYCLIGWNLGAASPRRQGGTGPVSHLTPAMISNGFSGGAVATPTTAYSMHRPATATMASPVTTASVATARMGSTPGFPSASTPYASSMVASPMDPYASMTAHHIATPPRHVHHGGHGHFHMPTSATHGAVHGAHQTSHGPTQVASPGFATGQRSSHRPKSSPSRGAPSVSGRQAPAPDPTVTAPAPAPTVTAPAPAPPVTPAGPTIVPQDSTTPFGSINAMADAFAQTVYGQNTQGKKGSPNKPFKPTANPEKLRLARAEAREKRQADSRFKQADKNRKREAFMQAMLSQMMQTNRDEFAATEAAAATHQPGAEDDQRVLQNIESIEEEFYDVLQQFSNEALETSKPSDGATVISHGHGSVMSGVTFDDGADPLLQPN